MLVTLAEQSNKKYFIQEMRRIITRTRINTQEDDRVRNPQIAMFQSSSGKFHNNEYQF